MFLLRIRAELYFVLALLVAEGCTCEGAGTPPGPFSRATRAPGTSRLGRGPTRSGRVGRTSRTAPVAHTRATADPELLRNPQVQRAREAVQRFKTSLRRELATASRQGPAAAILACRNKAPELAAAESKGGIRIGRTSHRLRNPKNAAPDWVRPLLERYLKDPEGLQFRVKRMDKGVLGYVEPIYVSRSCIGCHGSALDERVSARIKHLYPKDQATGFEAGALRGLFWAEVDPGPGAGSGRGMKQPDPTAAPDRRAVPQGREGRAPAR